MRRGAEDFGYEDVQEGRQGATLTDTSREREEARDVAVDDDCSLDVGIEEFDPAAEGRAKAHGVEGFEEELPVDFVKGLLLV